MHAIVGWDLDLIAPQICEFIGAENEGRTDEEGYTSEWLLKLDKWLEKHGLQSLGIWSDGDGMFGGEPSFFIGYYITDENIWDWVENISEPMLQLKMVFEVSNLDIEPKLHHRDDSGFAYARDYDFNLRLTPEQLEKQKELIRNSHAEKLKRGIEKLQDKTNEERYSIIYQLPFEQNPEIYSLCKELLREPDEGFWLQLGEHGAYLGMDFIGYLLPEMIHGLKSDSEIVRQCSKVYLSEYLDSLPSDNEDLIFVLQELKNFEVDLLKELLGINLPPVSKYRSEYYELRIEMINEWISKIIEEN